MYFNYNNAIQSNFKITFPKNEALEFYAVSTNIPTTTLGAIEVNWQATRAKVPDNKYIWDDITVQFILDENLYVYELIKNWQKEARELEEWQHGIMDMFVIPLDSNKNIEYKFLLQGAWPYMISGWHYTSGGASSDVITFDVTFAYQHFDIMREKPLDLSILK